MESRKEDGIGSSVDPLPPLTERIPRTVTGALEFKQLMSQLLLVHADRNHFLYTAARRTVDPSCFDGFAEDGIPGLHGRVAFEFRWPQDDQRHDPNSGNGVADSAAHIRALKSALAHWILITPEDLQPSEIEWLTNINSQGTVKVQHWGQSQVEQLLRQCPSLLARYYPHASDIEGYGRFDFREFATTYREKVVVAHGHLRTVGLPPETLRERDSRTELTLRELFVPIRLIPEGSESKSEHLQDVLLKGFSAVILGDPGMGKSTLLAYLALLFAGGTSLEGVDIPSNIVPMFVSLREFVRAQQSRPDLSFVAFLEMRARERLQLPAAHRAFFEAALRMGEAVVLLDGLDEVGGDVVRHRVATEIRTFRADYPDCWFWVTSRIYGYTSAVRLSDDDFRHYRIGHLDDEQVNTFVDRWYAVQLRPNPVEARAQANSLTVAIHRTPSVRRLAGNPLLLTLMAFIHHGLRKLPQDRGELYERCVEMLLKTWQEARREDTAAPAGLGGLTLPVHLQKDYLAHLALSIQERNEGKADDVRGLVTRRQALDCLTSRHLEQIARSQAPGGEQQAREEMERFLDYVADETGLLIDRGGGLLSFIHLSFQEYLAAWVFICTRDTPRGAAFFIQHIADSQWEEVLLLRCYVILHGAGGPDELDAILAALLRRLGDGGPVQAWLTLTRALRDDIDLRREDQGRIFARAIDFWLEAPLFEGPWFSVLEEVCLFAERTRTSLRAAVWDAQTREPVARAVACLHLEARLFGLSADVCHRLCNRSDFPQMLPDLIAFIDEASLESLLAERASVADWSKAFRALDGPAIYRMTLRWTSAPTAAVGAALGLMWRKILGELNSRRSFATTQQRRDAALSGRWGCLTTRTLFSTVTLPFPGLRALTLDLPDAATIPPPQLLCDGLARTRLAIANRGAWPEFTSWATTYIRDVVAPFSVEKRLAVSTIQGIADAFVGALGGRLMRQASLGLSDNGRNKVNRDFAFDFVHGFVYESVSGLMRLIVRNLAREFGHQFGPAIVRTFAREFARDFARDDLLRDLGRDLGIEGYDPKWDDAFFEPSKHAVRQLRVIGDDSSWNYSLEFVTVRDNDPRDPPATLTASLTNPLALPLLIADMLSAIALQHNFTAFRAFAVLDPQSKAPEAALLEWFEANPVDVYGVALAWREYGNRERHQDDAQRALFVAHAAYASLMTGIECRIDESNVADRGPYTSVSRLIYELCCFRDVESNVPELLDALSSAEVRTIVETAGVVAIGGESQNAAGSLESAGARMPPSANPEAKRVVEPRVLFSWLHLSDVHFGHRDPGHRWDQQLVLDSLNKDIASHGGRAVPTPNAILVTGDVAFSGSSDEYTTARTWLLDVAGYLSLSAAEIFIVAGNHDVDRTVDKKKRSAARLVQRLREGKESLDEVLSNSEDKALLCSRIESYLSFAATFPHLTSPDPLFWSHSLVSPLGLPVRIVGLNTALLAADDGDQGKLWLGKEALARTITSIPEGELVIVLTHHPFREHWLADQSTADTWIRRRGSVHLFGHIHDADSEEARYGTGSGIVRIAAGAVHGDKLPPGQPASHGYSFAAVVQAADGSLHLRVWPRRWSEKKKTFVSDIENTPDDRSFAEHSLWPFRSPTAK